MGNDQGIGIILCHFPNCFIIYPVGTFYCCPGQVPSNFKFGFQKVTSEPIEHCEFVDLQGSSWRSTNSQCSIGSDVTF